MISLISTMPLSLPASASARCGARRFRRSFFRELSFHAHTCLIIAITPEIHTPAADAVIVFYHHSQRCRALPSLKYHPPPRNGRICCVMRDERRKSAFTLTTLQRNADSRHTIRRHRHFYTLALRPRVITISLRDGYYSASRRCCCQQAAQHSAPTFARRGG